MHREALASRADGIDVSCDRSNRRYNTTLNDTCTGTDTPVLPIAKLDHSIEFIVFLCWLMHHTHCPWARHTTSVRKIVHPQRNLARQLKRLHRIHNERHLTPDVLDLEHLFRACKIYWGAVFDHHSNNSHPVPKNILRKEEELLKGALRFVKSLGNKLRAARQHSRIERWISTFTHRFEWWNFIAEVARTDGFYQALTLTKIHLRLITEGKIPKGQAYPPQWENRHFRQRLCAEHDDNNRPVIAMRIAS